jgi:hypothetical protein
VIICLFLIAFCFFESPPSIYHPSPTFRITSIAVLFVSLFKKEKTYHEAEDYYSRADKVREQIRISAE